MVRTSALSGAFALAGLTWLLPAGIAGASPVPTSPAAVATSARPGPAVVSEAQNSACASVPAKAKVGQSEQASAALGPVSVKLSGTAAKSKYGGALLLAHASLEIWQGAKVVYHQPLAVPAGDALGPGHAFWPQSVTLSDQLTQPLCVTSFGGATRQDAVVIGMYSGGAHCCTWADIYPMPGGKVAAPIEHDFGDPGVVVSTNGGRAILQTADDSFAYEFDAFAFSGLPVLVYEVQGAKLVNTTKHHLGMVKANASMYWTAYKQAQDPKSGEGKGGGLGVLAAWVADECNLGQGQSAFNTVAKLESAGQLTGGPNDKGGPWPAGAKYVSVLKSFLVQHNYHC